MEHPAPSWVTPSPSPRWGRLERVVRASQGPGLPPPLLSDTGQVFAGRLTCPTNQLPPHSLAQGGVWGDWEEPLLQCPLKTHETGSHLLATPQQTPPTPGRRAVPLLSPLGTCSTKPGPTSYWLPPHPSSTEKGGGHRGKAGVPVPSARREVAGRGLGVRQSHQMPGDRPRRRRRLAHLTPILQSITHGESKSASRSSIWL